MKDQELLQKTKELAREERRVCIELLHHVREIERRRLHQELGHGPLHEFMVRELGYSDGAAFRRIAAMRLLKELPEVDEALASGRLTLSTASTLQTFFKSERKTYSLDDKRELLKSIENKSKRECEKLLRAVSPRAAARFSQRERVVGPDQIEVRFIASDELVAKLKKIRGLIAHRHADPTYGELIGFLADLALKKLDPSVETRKVGVETQTASPEKLNTALEAKPKAAATLKASLPRKSNYAPLKESRYIPREMRREIWRRDQGRCSFIEPRTQRRCASQYALEIDHIEPLGLGGSTELENLRLLCANHNQFLAVRSFGIRWRRQMAARVRR